MDTGTLWKVFIALAPTVGVLFIFYHVIKGILEGDRRERIAHAQWEREHDRAARVNADGRAPGNAFEGARDTDPATAQEKWSPGNGGIDGGRRPDHR